MYHTSTKAGSHRSHHSNGYINFIKAKPLFFAVLLIAMANGCSYDQTNEYFDCGGSINLGNETCQCTATEDKGGTNSINKRISDLRDYSHCSDFVPQSVGSVYSLRSVNYLCTATACGANEIQSKDKLRCINITTKENCGKEGNACTGDQNCLQLGNSYKCGTVSDLNCSGTEIVSRDGTHCVDIATSENCGSEGNACNNEQQCIPDGAGNYDCQKPALVCSIHEVLSQDGENCIDITTKENCGAEGNACGATEFCNPTANPSIFACASVECHAPEILSEDASQCIDITTTEHCGHEGNACPDEHICIPYDDTYRCTLACQTEMPQSYCECHGGDWECIAPAIILNSETGDAELLEGDSLPMIVTLNRKPEKDVIVTLSANYDQPDIVSLSSDTITLTPEDWDSPHLFMLYSSQDFKVLGNQVIKVSAKTTGEASDLFYNVQADYSVNYIDQDICTLVFDNTAGLTTSENGEAVTVNARLTCIPESAVTYTFESDNKAEGDVTEGSSLTFNATNWNVEQPLTITGVDDSKADDSVVYHVKATPAASNPASYQNEYELTLTNTDNDAPGIVSSNLMLTEGESGIIAVALATQPNNNVTLTIGEMDGVVIENKQLTFTPSNYSTPQSLQVSVANNDTYDGDRREIAIPFQTQSADENYSRTFEDTYQVIIVDDDAAGVKCFSNDGSLSTGNCGIWSISEPSTGSTPSSGNTFSAIFQLTSRPKADVTITLDTQGVATTTLQPGSSVTITPEDWKYPETWLDMKNILVTVLNDGLVPSSSPVVYPFTLVGTSTDPDYNGILATGKLSVTDANSYTLKLDPSYRKSLDEGDTTAFKLCVNLNAKPSSSVTVKATTNGYLKIGTSNQSLTFGTSNWSTQQCFTYSAVDDSIVNGTRTDYITLKTTSTDSKFNNKTYYSEDITINDNDRPGIVVNASRSDALVCTDSNNNSIDYSVKLSQKPSSNVTVNTKLNFTTGFTMSKSQLTFTPSNYNTAQTVTVTCTTNNSPASAYALNTITFSSGTSSYYFTPPTWNIYHYPMGTSFTFNKTKAEGSVNTYQFLPKGNYTIEVWGAQGGGDSTHGGKGGYVKTNIAIPNATYAIVYIGAKGSRGPQSSSDTNNSAGSGRHYGGYGDYGKYNWSYGGGGSSAVALCDPACVVIEAGGGGGATEKSSSGYMGIGGKGGCENPSDKACKGSDSGKSKFSNGATQTNGNGQSSPSGDAGGAGGGGEFGGSAGSQHVGGNGGTSVIASTQYTNCKNMCPSINYTIQGPTTYTAGVQSGKGKVVITVRH